MSQPQDSNLQLRLLFENNSGEEGVGGGGGSIAGVEKSGNADLSSAYPSLKKGIIGGGGPSL